jgi:hypothetical protein
MNIMLVAAVIVPLAFSVASLAFLRSAWKSDASVVALASLAFLDDFLVYLYHRWLLQARLDQPLPASLLLPWPHTVPGLFCSLENVNAS